MRRPAIYLSAAVATGLAVAGLAATPALAATTDSSGTAAPATDTLINAAFPVTGTEYLSGLQTSLDLGPGTLNSTLDLNTGAVTGSLNLPPSTGSFTAAHYKTLHDVPVTVTTELVADGPTTGTADLTNQTVSTTTKAYLKVDSLTVGGASIPIGNNCETATPVTISVSSTPGFGLLTGGNVAGTFSIPPFGACGQGDGLLNQTIKGGGNTITLTLGSPALSLG